MGSMSRAANFNANQKPPRQDALPDILGQLQTPRRRNRSGGQISSILWAIAIVFFSTRALTMARGGTIAAAAGGATHVPVETDYLALFNKRFGQGVTALNNAAVPVVILNRPGSLRVSYEKFNGKAWLPVPLPDGEIRICQALGITSQELRGPVFSHYIQFAAMLHQGLRDGSKSNAGVVAPVPEYITGRFMKKPWKYKPNPWIEIWLRKQKPAFRVLVAASRRPRFFIPLLPVHAGGTFSLSMVPNLDDEVGEVQDMCQDLIARAMMELGEKHIRRCRRDLLAAHRFAMLMTQEHTGLAILAGFSLAADAMDAERTLAASGELSASAAARFLKEIQSLPAPVSIADSDDTIGRWQMLSILEFLANHPSLRSWTIKRRMWPKITQKWTSRQYRAAIPAFNDLIDQMVHIERIKNLTHQIQRLSAMLGVWRKSADLYQNAFAALHSGSVSAYTFEEFGEFAADSRVTDICLAIAAFQRSRGHFPKTLNQLVPTYFVRVPRNPSTGRPFVYRATAKKCSITSYETFPPAASGDLKIYRIPPLIVRMHAR